MIFEWSSLKPQPKVSEFSLDLVCPTPEEWRQSCEYSSDQHPYVGKLVKNKLSKINPNYIRDLGHGLLVTMPDGFCSVYAISMAMQFDAHECEDVSMALLPFQGKYGFDSAIVAELCKVIGVECFAVESLEEIHEQKNNAIFIWMHSRCIAHNFVYVPKKQPKKASYSNLDFSWILNKFMSGEYLTLFQGPSNYKMNKKFIVEQKKTVKYQDSKQVREFQPDVFKQVTVKKTQFKVSGHPIKDSSYQDAGTIEVQSHDIAEYKLLKEQEKKEWYILEVEKVNKKVQVQKNKIQRYTRINEKRALHNKFGFFLRTLKPHAYNSMPEMSNNDGNQLIAIALYKEGKNSNIELEITSRLVLKNYMNLKRDSFKDFFEIQTETVPKQKCLYRVFCDGLLSSFWRDNKPASCQEIIQEEVRKTINSKKPSLSAAALQSLLCKTRNTCASLVTQIPLIYPGCEDLVSGTTEGLQAIYNAPCATLFQNNNQHKDKLAIDDRGNVYANPAGQINKDFAVFLNVNGFNITAEILRQAEASSGGHSNLRFLSDLNLADNLNRIFNRSKKRRVFLVDVGAKYGMMSSLITKLSKADKGCTLDYIPLRPNLSSYDVTYNKENAPRYKDKLTEKQNENDKIVFRAIRAATLQEFEQALPLDFPHLFEYVWSEHATLKNASGKPLITQFIQKKQGTNFDMVFLLNDCHYYLQDWVHRSQTEVYISGLEFFPVPGYYRMPGSDGYFQVTQNEQGFLDVLMKARSSGVEYKHSSVELVGGDQHKTKELNFGWFKCFQAHMIGECPTYLIQQIRAPFFKNQNIQQSPQYQWMNDHFQKLLKQGNLITLQNAQRRWQTKSYDQVQELILQKYTQQKFFPFHTEMESAVAKQVQIEYASFFLFLGSRITSAVIVSSKGIVTKFVVNSQESTYFDKPIYKNRLCRFVDENIIHQSVGQQKESQVQILDQSRVYVDGMKESIKASSILKKPLTQVTKLEESVYGKQTSQNNHVKKMRLPTINASSEQKYYYDKPCEGFKMPADSFLKEEDKAYLEQNSIQLQQYFDSNKRMHVRRSKNQLIEPKYTSKIIQTGWKTGHSPYEFSSKSVNNTYQALFWRFLASDIQTEPHVMQDFNVFTDEFFSWLENQVQLDADFTQKLVSEFDPIKWLEGREGFTQQKKEDYFKNMMLELRSSSIQHGPYFYQVKEGEVYQYPGPLPDTVELDGVEERCRGIMAGASSKHGFECYIQDIFHKIIKRHVPGYIQAMTKNQMQDTFKNNVNTEWKSHSIDGSAFESTQNVPVMQSVDDKMYRMFHRILSKYIPENSFFVENTPNIQLLLDSWLQSALNHENTVFVCLPGVNLSKWSDQMTKQFNQQFPNRKCNAPWKNHLYLKIQGCTFSGDPYTTLRNTMASLCYGWYYLFKSGIQRPWLNLQSFVAAAGDDLLIWCLNNITQSIRLITQDTKKAVKGLGQCIKEIKVSDCYDFDFCSKISYPGFYLTRNLDKMLQTKQFYNKGNQIIYEYPELHVKAIYDGLKSEKLSHLAEDLMQYRMMMYKRHIPDVVVGELEVYKKYCFIESEEGYKFQDQVNCKTGISLLTLLSLMSDDRIYVNGGQQPIQDVQNIIQQRVQEIIEERRAQSQSGLKPKIMQDKFSKIAQRCNRRFRRKNCVKQVEKHVQQQQKDVDLLEQQASSLRQTFSTVQNG